MATQFSLQVGFCVEKGIVGINRISDLSMIKLRALCGQAVLLLSTYSQQKSHGSRLGDLSQAFYAGIGWSKLSRGPLYGGKRRKPTDKPKEDHLEAHLEANLEAKGAFLFGRRSRQRPTTPLRTSLVQVFKQSQKQKFPENLSRPPSSALLPFLFGGRVSLLTYFLQKKVGTNLFQPLKSRGPRLLGVVGVIVLPTHILHFGTTASN